MKRGFLAWLSKQSEAFFLLACAVMLAWQLILPRFIGIANNGDFGKVAGPLCIEGTDHGANNFVFFQAHYLRGPTHCYNPGVPSSEIAVAGLASSIQQAAGDRGRFDIRWLGGLHALIFLGFYFSVLLLLRPLDFVPRLILSAAALWIFADVGLIAQLNSFYTDVAAILGGLTATVLAVHLIKAEKAGLRLLVLFGLAAMLFVTSKAQHGLFAFIPAGLAIAVTWRSQSRPKRYPGVLIAVALLAAMVWIVASTPDWYKAQARFNLIFFKIAKNSQTPQQDLTELGLTQSDLRYVGLHTFMPNSPMNDPAFARSFCSRSTYSQVLMFYVHHPARALSILWSDLRDEAWQRRPLNLSNYQREYGKPAGARTDRFGSWSALRTWLFRFWPAHILVWFAFVFILSTWLAIHSKSRLQRSVAWAILAIVLLAVGEFCFASLADACETYRHLLMFHVFTDVTVFLALLLPVRAART